MKRLFTGIIILFMSVLCVFPAIEIRSRQLTTSDGLANNTVRHIYQDSKGFIWLSTLNGLNRYDGNSFITIRPDLNNPLSLADNRVKDVEEDKNGFLWISTSPELYSCYDLKQACFVDFTGCGEWQQNYSYKLLSSTGDVWLWHRGNGCRRVSYANGAFSSFAFKEENDNLPDNHVNFVVEEKDGFVWIGTRKGLVSYQDGKSYVWDRQYSFIKHTYYNGNSYLLTADARLFCYVHQTGTFKQIDSLKEGIGESTVLSTLQIQDEWWIFTSTGTFSYNYASKKLERNQRLDIPSGSVSVDNRRNYWVFNHTGCVWYVPSNGDEIKHFQLFNNDRVGYIDSERYHIVHDSRDIIWISTYGNGLFAYKIHEDKLEHITTDLNGSGLINTDFLQYVAEDNTGSIWVSAEYSGLSQLQVLNEGPTWFFPEEQDLSDRSNAIRMISPRRNGEIWVATRKGGLFVYDESLTEKPTKRNYRFNIYAATEDGAGTVWLGSRGDGLCIGDKWYKHDNHDPSSLANDHIFYICSDAKQRMWVATFGGGLDMAEKNKDGKWVFRHFLNSSYSQSRVRILCLDANNMMWAGTDDGIYVFNPDSLLADPTAYYHYSVAGGQLRSNWVKCIFLDSRGNVILGMSGEGLSICHPEGDYSKLKFKHYGLSDGLVNDVVQAIEEDKAGNLWISTEYGISKFNIETSAFENFFFSNHMLGNVYSEISSCKTSSGKLLFGTNYGLLLICPSEMEQGRSPSSVVFTHLSVNGVEVNPQTPDVKLKESIAYTDRVELGYDQNSFQIDFTTFDYSESRSTKYKYKLEPYDKGWSESSSINWAAYKNLSPGEYHFKARACNGSGIWSEDETMLTIVVRPPYWKTNRAFLFYVILVIALVYFAFNLVRNFNRLRNRISVEKQLTEYKLVFFTNISHEFRTPLTLIQAALEKMYKVENIPSEIQSPLRSMEKSTKRMLRLINQLLEFRKMQNNKLALSLEETDVIAFFYEIYLTFKDASESKNMDFSFVHSASEYKMFIDKGYLDKVTYNLLSNAFKYTPSNGKIVFSVTVNEANGTLDITVSDTGVGIPKEKRDELFNRFMQSSFSGSSVGVGLHLSHELVMVHKGTIGYAENTGGGSVFNVTIPLDPKVYKADDFLIPDNALLREENALEEQSYPTLSEISSNRGADDKSPLNGNKVLVIEDDNDVRDFLKEELSIYFNVAVAADGTEGLHQAKEFDPDVIVCDVMMPGISGLEVTQRLKTDFNTCHIPVILLTALSADENHLSGIESGADAYITKPFSTKILLARIFKIIEQREKLRKKFSSEPATVLNQTLCTTQKDKQFAEKLQLVLEKHLGRTEFSVDEFATIMGVGRTVFYRKVRGITGYSPNEYIRVVRLKKAAEYLAESNLTVAEVSYKVGINDPFYFSKCFKLQFGVAPSFFQKGVSAEKLSEMLEGVGKHKADGNEEKPEKPASKEDTKKKPE